MDPFRFLFRLLGPVFRHPAWPRIRAAFIVWHVFSVLIVAFPSPVRATNKDNWKKPTVQAELKGWVKRLSWVGVERTPEQLQAWSQGLTDGWVGARAKVIAPFDKYLRAVNARQAWFMFTGPDREPQRLQVTLVTKNKERVPVFEMGRSVSEPELVDPAFLDAYRVRRAVLFASWGRGKDTFQLICRYFNKELRAQRDDVKDVECELLQQRVEHPARRGVERPTKVLRRLIIRSNGVERLSGEGTSTPLKEEKDRATEAAAEAARAARPSRLPRPGERPLTPDFVRPTPEAPPAAAPSSPADESRSLP